MSIAEGSTGQSDAEQKRFLGMALRSLMETVACQRIIARRYSISADLLQKGDEKAQLLARKLHAFRKSLDNRQILEERPP